MFVQNSRLACAPIRGARVVLLTPNLLDVAVLTKDRRCCNSLSSAEKRLKLQRRISGGFSRGFPSESIRAGTTADAQDAAGLNHVQAELFGAGENLG